MTAPHVASAGADGKNDDLLIADISKNERRGERIRIASRSYKGHKFIDVRLYITNTAGETIPTAKGIAIPPALLAEVIEGLQAPLK